MELVRVEGGRLGLPADQCSFQSEIYERDEGIDGRTHFPEDADTRLPKGECVWQVKSGDDVDPSHEFREENAALRAAIRGGADYVLFWTHSPTDRVRRSREQALREQARALRADAEVHFLDASPIRELMYANLAVLQRHYPWMRGVVTLDTWGGPLIAGGVAYKTDNDRVNVAAAIKSFIEEGSTHTLHVVGDPGVGRSRTVFEALRGDDIASRVLVAHDGSAFDGEIMTRIASMRDSNLVLVVDNCPLDRMQSLSEAASLSMGRVKLVTISTPPLRGGLIGPYQLVPPLKEGPSREIALQHGLSEPEADLVASFTKGYPGLTNLIARDFRSAGPSGPIGDLIRRNPPVRDRLAALIPEDERRRRLGLLSLFEKLGFEDEMAVHTSLACDAFGVDEAAFRRDVEEESGTLVAPRGRYRYITPPLVAAWLLQEFVEDDPAEVVACLNKLPDVLQTEVVAQFGRLASSAGIAKVVISALGQEPFSSGALGDVDGGAARFLHVAATVVPKETLDVLERILDASTDEVVKASAAPRREVVWALESIAWLGECFPTVARLLLRLAVNENEHWGNNSTGVLQGLFQVRLGGTTAPYAARLAWADEAHQSGGEGVDRILIPTLGNAFRLSESRTVLGQGGRVEPAAWQPASLAEDVETRLSVWELLLNWARESEATADLVAPVVAGALSQLSRLGVMDRLLAQLVTVDWSIAARRPLLEEITTLIRLGGADPEVRARLESVIARWEEDGLDARIRLITSTNRWRLLDERSETNDGRFVPRKVEELAAELAALPLDRVVEVARSTIDGDPETLGILFEEISRHRDDLDLLQRLQDLDPSPASATLGTFAGLHDRMADEEVDALLETWIAGLCRDLVMRAVSLLPATPGRVAICLRAVSAGAPAVLLGNLYYGNWCAPLDQDSVSSILEALLAVDEGGGVGPGLAILDGWLENRKGEPVSDRLRESGRRLLERAAALSTSDPMRELHGARVLGRLGLAAETQVALVMAQLAGFGVHPGSELLEEFDRLSAEAPGVVCGQLLDWITSPDPDRRLGIRWLESHALVSRAARVAGGETLLDLVRADPAKYRAVNLAEHIDFSGQLPEPWLSELFEVAGTEEFRSTAMFHFLYPRSGWMGPQSSIFGAARARAESWLGAADSNSTLGQWLADVIAEAGLQFERASRDEAERGW